MRNKDLTSALEYGSFQVGAEQFILIENQQPFQTDLRKRMKSFMQNISTGSSIWRVCL